MNKPLFNSTNCHVVINGQWLDDACAVSWQQQADHEALFGYMDTRFRAVAKSAGIVSGTIGVYFHEHDKFFRYLYFTQGQLQQIDAANEQIEETRRLIEKAAQSQQDTADLIGLISTLDLNSEDFASLEKGAYAAAGVTPPPSVMEQTRLADDPDVIGDAGFKAANSHSHRDVYGQRIPGARLEIYHGDDIKARQVEVLYGFYILGRARTPIENRAGVGAQPQMEYFSFIASHVQPRLTVTG
jgi:hypothetical protein